MGMLDSLKRIFEDGPMNKTDAQKQFEALRASLMEPEDIKRADWYLSRYTDLKAEMDVREVEWNTIHDCYKSEREDETKSFVNIMQPQIEGQVAAMIDYNTSCAVKGKGIEDAKFAKTLDPVAREIIEHNKIKSVVKRVSRRYVEYGNCNLEVLWDADALSGFGMPKLKPRPITRVLFDGKIKQYEDIDKADYIILPIEESYNWLVREYGEDIASAVEFGNKHTDFTSQYQIDDENGFILLKIYTKNNEEGNLQQILMSENGIMLEQSDPATPFHEYTNNRYPIFATGCYELDEGALYMFGDGRLLYPIQQTINKLYDEILLAVAFASQGRTFADPNSGINPNEYAEADPSQIIFAANPTQSILTVAGQGINPIVFNLLEQLFYRVQQITRFSSLMTGNSTGENMTATQAGIQQQQGATGINDKKSDISNMLNDAIKFAIQLCFEHWTAAKAFRISEDKDDFEWIDVRTMRKIPKLKPASNAFKKKFKEQNPGMEAPEYEILAENDGEASAATKVIDFDISLSLGEGLPSNKMALYNLVLSLSQVQMIDEAGQPRSLLSFEKARKMLEDILGIKIEEDEGQPTMATMTDGTKMPIVNPNVTPNNQMTGTAQGTSLGMNMGANNGQPPAAL